MLLANDKAHCFAMPIILNSYYISVFNFASSYNFLYGKHLRGRH